MQRMFQAVFTCFSPDLRVRSGGGGRAPKGRVHNLLMQFFNPDSSKMEVFETCFFDIVITLNYHPRYVKHVLGRIYVFHPIWILGPRGGGVSQGIGTQPAYVVCHPGQLKNRSFRNLFFYIVTTQNDHPSYGKHVLGRIYVFFTLFGYQVGGGGSPKGRVHNLLMQFFNPDSSKMEVFETCFCDIVIT